MEAFIQFFDCAYEPGNESIPLCILHYNKWYRHTHHSYKVQDDFSKSRPVPKPQLLQQFLQANTEFTSTFDDEDRVRCAKHIKQSVQSTDSDLKNIISTIKHSLGTVGEIQIFESAVEYAARLVATDVGEALLNQTTILLPQTYDISREKLMSFPEVIDADKFISSLDEDLWDSICLLTQPTTDRSKNTQTRKISRIFAVCTLLFTINRQCSSPLHTLITDAVETYGGSTRLQKLLNRLGICASIETHSRYVQYRVEKINKEGPMSGFPVDSFMIVSADNLDYVHK